MMTKFDWAEMKRAKFERQEREEMIKRSIEKALAVLGVAAVAFVVCGGITL